MVGRGSPTLGRRKMLIDMSLSSIPIYHMSMYLLHKTNIKRMDKSRKRFFWQGGAMKRKYHLIKWSKNCALKGKGGLGIKDLARYNNEQIYKRPMYIPN